MGFLSAIGSGLSKVGSFLQPFAGAAGNVLGSLFSAKSQAQTNQANADQAQAQMDFQERMSSTAHQREVDDLKKAGLNPILSANAGASTPGGAMANFQNPYDRLSEDLGSSAKNFGELSLNRELIKTQQSQQLLNSSSAARNIAETKPRSEINKAIDILGNAVANSARWIGEKTANLDIDLKGVHKRY